MEALRIVCNHKDLEEIKELKILKQKHKQFIKYLSNLNDIMDDILWANRKPPTKEEYDNIYDDVREEVRARLWKRIVDTREKYPTMFDKLSHTPSDDSQTDFNNWESMIENEGRLEGVTGCIRSLMVVYNDIFDTRYCECSMNDCECKTCCCDCGISCQCKDNCEDCMCAECNLCVYTACKCETLIDDELSNITSLELDLDT